ncbi:MAG: Formylmethanofuran dehydrogenase subunit A [Methanophagales archaeon]|nr:Formylmethanofuran dehydrogenase subunit A [Methanophagales archaeon]
MLWRVDEVSEEMAELLIKNGVVFDPINGVRGERMDICIRDGKIVESLRG